MQEICPFFRSASASFVSLRLFFSLSSASLFPRVQFDLYIAVAVDVEAHRLDVFVAEGFLFLVGQIDMERNDMLHQAKRRVIYNPGMEELARELSKAQRWS